MNVEMLKGKRAFVSGATEGIANAISIALAECGCDLFLTATEDTKLKKVRSAYAGFGGISIYCASKHALLDFSRAIHDELKDHNVRTYFISPSSTQSKMGLGPKGHDYSTFLDPNDVAKYAIFAISFDSNVVSEAIILKRMIVR